MMNAGGQREIALNRLAGLPLDVLIIGGGIVGAGIARDAALRGLRTALVEQHDFAFGTSSRSSRLLHGGLRYLAQGRLGLVREASVEKTIVHHIAPHLAEPLPFIFPTYRGDKHWVLWQLKIGVKIYDLLCGGRNLGKSTFLNPLEVSNRVPALNTVNLKGAVRYYDGFTNDARLTIDTLRSAEKNGAALLNYCRFENAQRSASFRPGSTSVPHEIGGDGGRGFDPTDKGEKSRIWECEVADVLAGQKFVIPTRIVVNATGPWADGLPHSAVKLRVTKGIHVVVERRQVPVPETVVMTEGKRILFAIPWGSRTILGTTDSDYAGSLDHVVADAADIQYVLKITNRFFPQAHLEAVDVINAWAGLRPLLADPNGKPADISRSHEITNPKPGWWDVAGGKLTTYRLMAEQTVDRIIRSLGRQPTPCRTATEPLRSTSEPSDISGILPPEFERRVVEHFCGNEWAVHLDDVMVRRTSWHYYHRDAASKAEQVSRWMSEILGWDEVRRHAELARYRTMNDCQVARQPSSSSQSCDDQQPLAVV